MCRQAITTPVSMWTLPGNSMVLAEVERLAALAPLHQGLALAIARLSAAALPEARQLLCFDTAFHHTQPQLARLYGLPLRFFEAGVQRYGFHGLSCEYIAGQLRELAPQIAAGRVVVAHLGSGSSLTALRDGRSIATTMGMTPLDGLPMGTRCGGLDPGAVLYLQQQLGLDAAATGELLNHESGLLGLSGLSSDVRVLEASQEPAATLALQYFVYRISRELGSLVAALGGLDTVVFTGGIGAHSASIRAGVCEAAAWTGLRLDAAANRAGAQRIAAADSAVSVWVLETDEELVMARALQRQWRATTNAAK
jgi:acetate kinase